MGRNSYRGGSTLLKIWPAGRSKPRSEGLLKREVDFAKHGIEPVGPLLSPKEKKFKAKRKPKPSVASLAREPVSVAKISKSHEATVETRPPKPSEGGKQRYANGAVAKYLTDHHSRCPKAIRKRIDKVANEGRWAGLALDQLALRSAEHYVLTEVCGIHRLVECGLDAASANKMVAAQKKAIMVLWGF